MAAEPDRTSASLLLPSLDEALTDGLDETFRKAAADLSRTHCGLVGPLDASQGA